MKLFNALKSLLLALALAALSPAFAQDKVKGQWLGQAAFKITSVNGKVIVITLAHGRHRRLR